MKGYDKRVDIISTLPDGTLIEFWNKESQYKNTCKIELWKGKKVIIPLTCNGRGIEKITICDISPIGNIAYNFDRMKIVKGGVKDINWGVNYKLIKGGRKCN